MVDSRSVDRRLVAARVADKARIRTLAVAARRRAEHTTPAAYVRAVRMLSAASKLGGCREAYMAKMSYIARDVVAAWLTPASPARDESTAQASD